jgi:hypothetical protein
LALWGIKDGPSCGGTFTLCRSFLGYNNRGSALSSQNLSQRHFYILFSTDHPILYSFTAATLGDENIFWVVISQGMDLKLQSFGGKSCFFC